MATANAPRFLSDGSTDYGLNLTQYWGAMLEQFYAKTVFYDNEGRVFAYKNITTGKSHQFIQIDEDPDPEDHTPGTELLGQDYAFDEGTVTVDDILVAHFEVPIDQSQLSHFDVMRPLLRKLGRSLAQKYDNRFARLLTLAARTAAKTGYHNGGNVVERVGASGETDAYPQSATGAANFRSDAAELARLMDEDNVPEDGRFLFVKPYISEVLSYDTRILSRDYAPDLPNDLIRRSIGMLEGFMVIKTNHVPNTNVTTGPSKYQGDFTYNGATAQPVALAACGAVESEAACGVVEAMMPTVVIIPSNQRNRLTTHMRAQMMIGADVLSPYCAGEIRVDDA